MATTHTLAERVEQFQTLSLPGQSMMMHMGTSYLVNDLWRAHTDMLTALMLVEPILGRGPVTQETIEAYKAVADAIALANGMPRAKHTGAGE